MKVRAFRFIQKNEDSTIQLMERFGWELSSSQDVVTKDTHEELRGDTVYSVTETERYVKLVFKRDKERNNYEKYRRAEELYYLIPDLRKEAEANLPSYALISDSVAYFVIMGIVSLFAGLFLSGTLGFESIGVGLVIAVMLFAGVSFGVYKYRLKYVKPKHEKLVEKHKLEIEEAKEKLRLAEEEFASFGI